MEKGHFARECRSGRIQGRRSYGDNGRGNAPTNESSSQALVAQDGLGGYDWSNDFEVEPVNYALMGISSSSSSSSSDSEVQKCSKQCLESFKCLQKNYDTEREKHKKAKLEISGYEIALESLESRIIGHEKNEISMDLRMDRSCAANSSYTCPMANLNYSDKHNMVAFLKKPNESVGFAEVVDFLKGTSLRYALTYNPTIYDSLVKQFWQTATVRTLTNGTQQLIASIDSTEYNIIEASVRSKLQLADATGIHNLSDAEIYAGLATLGPKSGGWDQFGSNYCSCINLII
ncbi:hypothetical protein Tco_1466674 [Tanacetum coccineum]